MLLPASPKIYYYDAFRKTGRDDVASRAKRYPLCFSGSFRRRENCPLLVRGNAPKTPLNAQDARPRVSAKRLGA
jgi:hypothetical protein